MLKVVRKLGTWFYAAENETKVGRDHGQLAAMISETVQASDMNVKSYAVNWMVLLPTTLSDPNLGFKVTVLFKGKYLENVEF